ncbi:hypothetical protein Hanom_Chr06g00568621 [Helianthus anomalus]
MVELRRKVLISGKSVIYRSISPIISLPIFDIEILHGNQSQIYHRYSLHRQKQTELKNVFPKHF